MCWIRRDSPAEQWEIPLLRVNRDLTGEALEEFASLQKPCCGKKHGSEGWDSSAGVAAQIQNLLKQLDNSKIKSSTGNGALMEAFFELTW